MDLASRRLHNQFIGNPRFTDPAEVVRALCAVQAQDYLAALWAVGLRLRRSSEPRVERAITERRIVRTWPMRGTLHFVAAGDVRWLLALLAPRTLRRSAARLKREFSIDRAVIRRATRTVEAALREHQVLSRSALYERLDAARIDTSSQRGLHILWWLAHEGLICCGPRAGKQHTFVLLEEWIPPAPALPREEALVLLAQRYFAHHGPATTADFAWWSGITMTDAATAIEGSALSVEKIGKASLWSATQGRIARNPSCYLLPVYDEYTIGYADRSAALDTTQANHASAGHGIFRAPIVIGGRIVGSWARELKKRHIEVRVTPLTRFTRDQLLLIRTAAQRYGTFAGLPVKLIRA